MILLPVKNLANAKQRLASVLEQQARTELAQAMLSDVVAAIAAYAGDEVAIATSDPFAIELAHSWQRERNPSSSESKCTPVGSINKSCKGPSKKGKGGPTQSGSSQGCASFSSLSSSGCRKIFKSMSETGRTTCSRTNRDRAHDAQVNSFRRSLEVCSRNSL